MMYSWAHLHVLGRVSSCHAMFLFGELGHTDHFFFFLFPGIQDEVEVAEEYWTQNTSGLFAKKKFETAIWDAAYRCHLDG